MKRVQSYVGWQLLGVFRFLSLFVRFEKGNVIAFQDFWLSRYYVLNQRSTTVFNYYEGISVCYLREIISIENQRS
jgi:hypothetical protein